MPHRFAILLGMKTNTKSDTLAVRLYPEDKAKFSALAEDLELSPSRLLRMMIYHCSDLTRDTPRARPEFRDYVRKIKAMPLI